MFHRSGKGDVFELEESLFLGDLGIGKNALRRAKKDLLDDGWLSKAAQKIDSLTGKWGTTAWTVNTQPVALLEGVGTVAPFRGDRSRGDLKEGAPKGGDTVVLHSLGALNTNAHTSPVTLEGDTSSGLTNLPTNQSLAVIEKEEYKPENPQSSQARKEQQQPQQPIQTQTWGMPYSGSVYTYSKLWAQMQLCLSAFRGVRPSDEEVLLFAEIMEKCDENACYPDSLIDFAKTHVPPKLVGGLRSVRGLHNAVCCATVSTTNGLIAQFKDHKRPKDCPICLKKVQGITCKSAQGCNKWVELNDNGALNDYCPGCIKKIPAYKRESGQRSFLMKSDI